MDDPMQQLPPARSLVAFGGLRYCRFSACLSEGQIRELQRLGLVHQGSVPPSFFFFCSLPNVTYLCEVRRVKRQVCSGHVKEDRGVVQEIKAKQHDIYSSCRPKRKQARIPSSDSPGCEVRYLVDDTAWHLLLLLLLKLCWHRRAPISTLVDKSQEGTNSRDLSRDYHRSSQDMHTGSTGIARADWASLQSPVYLPISSLHNHTTIDRVRPERIEDTTRAFPTPQSLHRLTLVDVGVVFFSWLATPIFSSTQLQCL
ncbi:hypothetical protein F4802DRAFT_587049 [Xylaria palmicola]|nr:hypothetical protein F4802DRAFT_587049 [Xylaria palmicola]